MGSVENANKLMEEIIRKYIDRDQKTWDDWVSIAAYALNNTKSAAHGFTPDFLFFGRKEINPYVVNDQVIQNDETKYENFAKKIEKKLIIAFEIANDNLKRYRDDMIKYYDKKRKGLLPVVYYKDDWVYLNKPIDSVVKGLSHKLDKQSLGPYKIIQVDNEKGNILIEIAPHKELLVKHNNIRLAKNQLKLNDDEKKQTNQNKLIPTSINEVIVISDMDELKRLVGTKTKGPKPNKNHLTVKDLVGKRVKIEWKTGEYKGWHDGTVIGYTSNLTNSLIYYDQRDLYHDPRTDYYAHNLFSNKENWIFL